MIGIDFSWLVFLFTCIPISVMLIAWFITPSNKAFVKSLEIQDAVWNCEICTYIYFVFEKKALISQCPRCGSLNRKKI